MRIRLTTSRVTTLERQRFGQVIDLPEEEAVEMIRTRQALPVDPEPAAPPERTAPAETPEQEMAEVEVAATNRNPQQTRRPRHARPA